MAQNNDSPGKRLKREEAKFIKPTTQDSLDIYNSAQELNRYYGNPKHGYKLDRLSPNNFDEDVKNYLSKDKKYSIDRLHNKDIEENIMEIEKSPHEVLRLYSNWAKANNIRSAKDVQNLAIKAKKNYDSVMNNPYKGIIYDKITGAIDFAPPPAKFDTRIKDQGSIEYEPINFTVGGPGNRVELPYYDPIAIKPVSMLTPKERIEREKKYGKISSSTPKIQSQPVIKRKATEIIEPLAPRQAPSPIFSREEIIAPVPRPVDVPTAPPMKEPVIEEQVVAERPVARRPPKAVMPRRAGGWGNQPLLMQLFPRLYQK